MKNNISIFILSISMLMPGVVISENMSPPSGPYRSAEIDSNEKSSGHVPEWVKQRQIEMNKWIEQSNKQAAEKNKSQPEHNRQEKQQMMNRFNGGASKSPSQARGYPPMQWHPNNQPPMRMPVQSVHPQARQQPVQPNMNSMRQPFPMARGPVYGPNVPPATRYNYPNQNLKPNYQMQRPTNQPQPMWR